MLIFYVIVRVHYCVSVFTIKRPEGASAARVFGVLIVKILYKCRLSILVYNLFLDRQRNILCTPQYFHTQVYSLSSWNRNSNLIARKNRLDTKNYWRWYVNRVSDKGFTLLLLFLPGWYRRITLVHDGYSYSNAAVCSVVYTPKD